MKTLVALSGGVDSAVAALLLKDQGHDVAAAYIRSWMNEQGSDILADCPWEADIANARAVATHLGIDFEVVDYIREYRQRVVDFLVEGYRSGRTPNPDVMCNREMKFGLLRDYATDNGFEALATGHYCRKRTHADGTHDILEGLDPNKDQSYFLALVRQAQIRPALFPVGELEKPRVRAIARQRGLPNAERKDSQGICFLGKVDIGQFLAQFIPDAPGPIVHATDGRTLGEHRGLHRFTIGQRKGLGIPSNTDHKAYIVVAKNYDTNELRVAFDEPTNTDIYRRDARVCDLNWINRTPPAQCDLLARPRYRDPAQRIHLSRHNDNTATVTFEQAQRALAPGQIIAFYDGDTLLGGGCYC